MRISRIAGALLLTALAGNAGAQLMPPPVTATLVNFDDIDLGPNQQIPFLVVTNEYVNRGVQFAGFGQNSGGLFNPSFDPASVPYISLPNNIYFLSAFPVVTGGLAQSPEFLTFYPPIQYFQFDTGTFGIDCQGTSIVTIQGFAHDGTLLDSETLTATMDGETLALTLPPPGAEQVVVTSSHNCGMPGSFFFGVEIFSLDNVAFIPVAQPASKCAQGLDDAAGKEAKAVASCYAKALQKGVPVDDACLQKASDTLAKGFTNSQKKGDCLVSPDADATGAAVNAVIGQAIQMVTGGSPGPDVCFGKKLTSIGKKLQAVAKCFSSAAKSGASTDPACVTKAGGSFNSSLKACGTPTQLAPIEQLIDQFSIDLNRQQSVPTTTTTTTTTSTTTTTAPPPLGQHLSFTTSAGTANCGANQFGTPADPPFSGELDSDLVGTKLVDLGGLPLHRGRRGDGKPVDHPGECHHGPRQPRWHHPVGQPGDEPGGLLGGAAGLRQALREQPGGRVHRRLGMLRAGRLSGRPDLLLRPARPGERLPAELRGERLRAGCERDAQHGHGRVDGRHRALLVRLPDPRQAHHLSDL